MAILAIVPLLWPGVTNACTLPVFRYALERWAPTTYELYVIHDPSAGEVTTAQAAACANVIGEATNISRHVIQIAVDDRLGEVDKTLVEELKRDATATFPRVVLARSIEEGTPRILWSAPFAEPLPPQLLDSPARRQIAKHLLAGDSAVCVLVVGEDAAANARDRATLEDELRKAEKELTLPEQLPPDQADETSRMRSNIPLKLAFSIVEVKRNDPAEASLIRMLDRCDAIHDVKQAKPGDPAVYAVFGRGRAMPGLQGETFTPAKFRELCEFIVGPCSCQIKHLNPGLDLVMTVKWEESIFADAAVPSMTPAPQVASPVEQTRIPVAAVVTPEATPATPVATGPAEPTRRIDQRKVIVLIGVILLTVLAGVMWRRAS